MPNGILLIDKPAGPTSHDVVARVRRTARERSIGHAGTLDPAATGLLVLMLGKATRLSTLLMGHDKVYEAVIRFGWWTTTDDAQGDRLDQAATSALPADDAITAALDATRGVFDQLPPQYSAKRVDGTQAYKLARQDTPVALKTARVQLHDWTWLGRTTDTVEVRLHTSSGFYIRSLARDLGTTLGCGAHLSALRRVSSGGFQVADAVGLAEAEREGADLTQRLVPMAAALPELPAVVVSDAGMTRVRFGNPIGPQFVEGAWVTAGHAGKVRLLTPAGDLAALADFRGGQLHPSTVLV